MTPESWRPSEAAEPSSGRSARLAEAMQLLEAGVEEILTSDGFQQYLDLMSRFHQYSYGNVLLIMSQNPDATMVAGYRQWQRLGRQVRRGEQGIRIMVPYKRRIRDDVEDEDDVTGYVIRGFGTAVVFDVSQTDGESLPEPPVVQEIRESSEVAASLSGHLERFLARPGVAVVREDTRPALGYYSPSRRQIALDDALDGVQATKTLRHETAHFVADHLPGIHRRDAETVAESAAYVVLRHYGIDSGAYSFPYVARWAEDRGVLNRNLAAIQRVADAIIAGIEELHTEEQS